MIDFSLSDDDFVMILKGLSHLIESQCNCLTVGDMADAFDLIVKIEGLTDPGKGLLHLAESWDLPVSDVDFEL